MPRKLKSWPVALVEKQRKLSFSHAKRELLSNAPLVVLLGVLPSSLVFRSPADHLSGFLVDFSAVFELQSK